ncbi:helix-turn-helix domain-containing protein [Luteolibacter sp. Populi]|uniref:helix-turn-helix domain-containing protein n=1 Tax=Luteolibacter sp. Populi TaxID=3230487 RepID=UPI0034670BDA
MAETKIETETEARAPFIPAWLDELPLNAREFRVLVHLWRRGETFSSTETIARICRMKRDTVFAALRGLEAAGLIRRESRPGYTTLIRTLTPETVRPPSPVPVRPPSPRTGQDPSPETGHKGSPSKVPPLRVPHEGVQRHDPDPDPDAEFVATLKANPAYAGTSIDAELGKMQAWLLANPGRRFTRRFVVAWLNRIPPAPPKKVLNLGKRFPQSQQP